jgi:FkbM family methyltransferase
MSGLRYWIKRYLLEKPALRQAVTKLLERDQDHNVELLGTKLRINSIKEHGYLRASRKAHDSSLFRDEVGAIISLALLLSPGDSFVDVGANVGVFVCTLARIRHLYKDVFFYAFEANPDTFARLCKSAAGLGIATHQVALAGQPGELTFIEGAVSHVFTTSSHANAYHFAGSRHRVSVPCKRLDQFSFRGDSIILKIDVEGQEKDVLKGAEALLARDRIKAIFIDGYEDPSVADLLLHKGFSLFDGRTMAPNEDAFGLLAVKKSKASAT